MSRSVRWRSSASCAPPVSSGSRWSSRRRSACGVSVRTRGAASSIASGSPSSRRQISATASAFSSVSAKSGRGVAGALDEERDRLGRRERRDAVGLLAAEPQGRAAGREQLQAGRLGQQARERRRRGEHLLEVVEHEQQLLVAQVLAQRLERALARLLAQAERLRDRGQRRAPVRAPARAGRRRRRPRTARSQRPPAGARAASCRCRRGRSASAAARRRGRAARRASASSRSRPTKAFGTAGRLANRLSSVFSGGNSFGRPSISSW